MLITIAAIILIGVLGVQALIMAHDPNIQPREPGDEGQNQNDEVGRFFPVEGKGGA